MNQLETDESTFFFLFRKQEGLNKTASKTWQKSKGNGSKDRGKEKEGIRQRPKCSSEERRTDKMETMNKRQKRKVERTAMN